MEKLKREVHRLLPGRLAEFYKRGRAKVISARYGNPADTVRVIAVTGSYGKTTTAKLIAELLQETGRKVVVWGGPSGEHEDFVTKLQKVLKDAKKETVDFFILDVIPELVAEGGMKGIAIDTVVVTSKNAEAEALLGQAVNYAVVPDDHQAGSLALAEHQIITFGEQDSAEAKIDEVTLFRKGTEVKMTIDHHTPLAIATHLIGKANALNLAAAVATAYVLGAALDTVEEGAARLEVIRGNYQYVPSDKAYLVVVDAAAADRSAELVTESAKQLSKRRLIIALEGDPLSEEAIIRLKKQADRLILVSNEERALPGIEVVETPEEAIVIAQRAAKKDDTVLLLGRRFVENADFKQERT